MAAVLELEPQIGEIRLAKDIGKWPTYRYNQKLIWSKCLGCDTCRWVQYNAHTKEPRNLYCASCSAKRKGIKLAGRSLEHIKPLAKPPIKIVEFCDRCGSRFLYKNEDNDIECSWCGHIIYE